MNLRFDQPELLLLSLLGIPLAVLGWRWLSELDPMRRSVVTLLRVGLLTTLAVILAGPRTIQEHDDLTVIGLLDISGSIARFAQLPEIPELGRRSNLEYLRRWFRAATQNKAPDDRFGLIVFDGKATVISVPTKGDYIDDDLDVRTMEGTNLAESITLALAMFPAQTAKRLVLISDGNETIGDVLQAARQAAAGSLVYQDAPQLSRVSIPIDVVPIEYEVTGDVQVVRIETPPIAQPGQTITVRILLSSTAVVPGRLTLRREGEPIDLNGAEAGVARQIVVPRGESIQLAQAVLGETPINRFEVVFEPDDPTADALPENNLAEAFTATPSRGSVLVVDAHTAERSNVLAETLRRADLPVRVVGPDALGDDLLSLQSYDLIILDNVAAHELSTQQHELLSRYVHDLAGGLIMIGGKNSFGAGGWNGTALEAVLPLELDPPMEARLPAAALVLVLDKSGSMNQPVAGARASQQRVANEAAALAIESLRSESLIGVITFDFSAHIRVPMQRNDDPKRIADRVRGITADGGTNLGPALRAALDMLKNVEAERKRIVCLSDGRSHSANLDDIVIAMTAQNIKLTTIAIGDDADYVTLRRLAELGGGEFYRVHNPRTLPRILVDAVQVINKPLLKEVPFSPVVRPTGSILTLGMDSAPILGGLVITAPRDDPKVIVEMTDPDGDPLLAHWQIGMGRTAAFTSDADGAWSQRWIDWPGYSAFWAQLARTIARPPTSHDTELTTIIEHGRLNITLEAADEETGFLDYMHVQGAVYAPNGDAIPVRLRQTAPGRYEASVAATAPGNYVVALSPRRGDRRLAPVIGGATQSSNPEFRRYQSNRARMEQIAQLTGGRVLEIANPQAVDLFDRTGMPTSVSALPAWRTILWWSLVVVLLDVAARRLAWDFQLLRKFVAMALARVAPAHVRGGEAAATLASLRHVSAQVDRKLSAGAVASAPKPEARRPKHPPPDIAPPESSKVAAALASFLGKRSAQTHEEPQPPEPPISETDASETTSNLLAAKRRAQKRLGAADDPNTDEDESRAV